MDAKITPENQSLCKEWKSLTCRTCSSVNQKLGRKGWLVVLLAIIIVCVLGGAIAHHREGRFERGFGGRQNIMQERGGMMRRGGGQFQNFGNAQNVQGYAQSATVQINPQDLNANQPQQATLFFGRMQARMQQIFGSDQKGVQQAPQQNVTIPTNTVVVSGVVAQ